MSILHDVRLATRSLRTRPGLTFIVIATLAIGIGANVGVFGYLSSYLWPTVDAPNVQDLVRVETVLANSRGTGTSYPDFLDTRQGNTLFSQLMAYRVFGASFKRTGQTLHTWGHAVSADYFDLFGARPAIGRLLHAGDDRPRAEQVVVLNHLFWSRQLGGDRSVIGTTVYLNGRHPYRVVGVVEDGFQGQGMATEIYIPLATATTVMSGLGDRADRRVYSWGRLRPGVTIAQARAALVPLAQELDRRDPGAGTRRITLRSVTEPIAGPEDQPYVYAAEVLMAAVMLLLLLACANVANLLLARSEERRREMAILASLGAGRMRLLRRLLIESLLLAGAGGALGLALGSWSLQIIEDFLRQTVPVGMGGWGQATSLVVDRGALLGFATGTTLLTACLFGVAPILRLRSTDLVTALKGSPTGGASGGLDLRRGLVVVQVALSVVLLLGAGLLVRTLIRVQYQDLGFHPRNLLLATVYMPATQADTEERSLASYEVLLARLRTLPGVEAASLVQVIPLSGVSRTTGVRLTGQAGWQTINFNTIGPGYFRTLQIPVLRGREFDDRDRPEGTPVIVVNQMAADHLWPGQDPIGRRLVLRAGGNDRAGRAHDVVGVVADSRYQRVVDPIQPQIYVAFPQSFQPRLTFIVRTTRPLAGDLRQLLREHDPDLAFIDLVPFEEQLRRSAADHRMNADIAASFGVLGLILAGTGIFGVMSYTVSRRRQEFGIRMAVGASRNDVSRLVIGEAARLVLAGSAIGAMSAWVVSTWLSSILYGVSAHDAVTYAIVLPILAGVAMLAAWLPAHRASRVDPIRALRAE